MSIIDDAGQHLGPDEIKQIGEQIGADPATTQNAVQAAMPMLLGGVANAAQQPQNASAISDAISSHQGLLGNLTSFLGLGAPADGGSLLGRILGGHQQAVQQGVEQAAGLDSGQSRRLLLALAPVVMALLAKRHANKSHAELAPALQDEARAVHEQTARSSPRVGGLLGAILSHVESPRA